MRRIHLFEVEDLQQCPSWLRHSITNMLSTVHRWFDTASIIEKHLASLIPANRSVTIVDLCSGAGGPMPETIRRIRDANIQPIELLLTDLYPDLETAIRFNEDGASHSYVGYETSSIDATEVPNLVPEDRLVIRTMICSFHHMPPSRARAILEDAQRNRQPMLMFEMSDNSVPPVWLWWLTLFPNFMFGLVVAILTRPWTWRKFFFTFIVPIIPAAFAWDGAVSNVRTYNEKDLRQLLEPIKDLDYDWSVETIQGRMVNHLVVIGRPKDNLSDTKASV